jgi:hypothetical protein
MRDACSIISRRQLFLLAGATLRMGASEPPFWNAKPPAEWSTGDIYQLVNHSPWANPVQAWRSVLWDYADQARGGRRGLPPPPPQDFGPQGVVTWESARPIRDALKTQLPGVFANFYVIGVDGIPTGGPLRNNLRRLTVLRSNGKPKWSVKASVGRELIRNSAVYAFGFPKADAPIGPDTGDVVFQTQFGQWMIQAKFRPREMLYRGELAL